MHMTWDELQTVEALVRLGGVAAAARELSVQHSSVSRRIGALEARLGTPLFVRGARLQPTDLALQIADRARPMRTSAGEVSALLAIERRRRHQRLVVTTNDVLAPLLFRALASAKLPHHVEVEISDVELPLAPGQIDLALRPASDPSGALRGRRLGRLRLGVYAAPARSSQWIVPSASLAAKASMRWWRHIPPGASASLTCSSLLAMRDACRAGLGQAILPSFLATDEPQLRLERELEGGPPLWLLAGGRADPSTKASNAAIAAALRGLAGVFAG